MPKYKNTKITNEWGTFDSKLEANRYVFLLQAKKEGLIRNLRRQVEFELIPKQTRLEMVQMKTKTKVVERVVERPCHYIADFAYQKKVADKWIEIVEDTKGKGFSHGHFSTETPDFRIKKKLMLWIHNTEVKIVSKASQEV